MKRIFVQRRPPRTINLLVVVASVLLALAAAEFAGRVLSPHASIWAYPNYFAAIAQADPEHEAQMRHDAELGHEPVPGFKGQLQSKPISISAQGLRQHNGGQKPPAGPTVLVFGDSFTEGFLVGDDETWPAGLERLSGRRVLNAAVRAYGIDQMVLRAERIAPTLKPDTLVLAFITDDISRTELSLRHRVAKPYFVLDGPSGLKLANVPVPRASSAAELKPWQRVLGYSYLADVIVRRLGLMTEWYQDSRTEHRDGNEVACRLVMRFGAVAHGLGARGLVVALVEEASWRNEAVAAANRKRASDVLACAARAGLTTLDTWDGFATAGVARDLAAFYVGYHPTARSNELVARLVAAALEGTAK
jgi:hypothetical protein